MQDLRTWWRELQAEAEKDSETIIDVFEWAQYWRAGFSAESTWEAYGKQET